MTMASWRAPLIEAATGAACVSRGVGVTARNAVSSKPACQRRAGTQAVAQVTHSAPSGSALLASSTATPSSEKCFLGFAWSAYSDVASVHHEVDGQTWPQRLQSLSSSALDLWPPESPHWRVAGNLLFPKAAATGTIRRPGIVEHTPPRDLVAALAVVEPGKQAPGGGGLGPEERSTCVRAICALRGDQHMFRDLAPVVGALVSKGGVRGSKAGLASQLSIGELLSCVRAIGRSDHLDALLVEEAVQGFVTDAKKRLSAVRGSASLEDLHEVRTLLRRFEASCDEVEAELRSRLRLLDGSHRTDTVDDSEMLLHARANPAAVVVCAYDLGEPNALRGSLFRQALLPSALSPEAATRLLLHWLPTEGLPSVAHEFIASIAVERILKGARGLNVPEVTCALQGVLKLQLVGTDFTVQGGARVLRALWPRVSDLVPHLGPTGLSAALRSYFWQLQCSRQEFALTGASDAHPLIRRTPAKDHDAVEALKTKLLWPTLARLPEMPLAQVNSCLTAIATPIGPSDFLSIAERLRLRRNVEVAFPAVRRGHRIDTAETAIAPPLETNASSHGEAWLSRQEHGQFDQWSEDFWTAELKSLNATELLELACGLREAAPDLHDPAAGRSWWALDSVLSELEKRLRPSNRHRPSVELSHFLLLRMCRVMELWREHEVEEVLRQLLSDPEAMKPLPTPLFVGVLAVLRAFSVPKELPLRLAASFLDRVDRGEREVQPIQWAELFCAVRHLDDQPSYERVTPRILQQLVPHLGDLPASMLLEVMKVLASKPLPSEPQTFSVSNTGEGARDDSNRGGVGSMGSVGGTGGCGPLELAPRVATDAVKRTIEAGHWGLPEIVEVLGSLGSLGWSSDACLASALSQCMEIPLLETHAQHLLPLFRACTALRVHHAPLLHKFVRWHVWCHTYLRPKPLSSPQLDELIMLAEELLELSYQSLELHGIVAENLKNPNASARQVLALLSALARFSHFPPAFKEACSQISSESTDNDLASLSTADLINAFNIHLCAVFDGPAALKHWLTEDAAMKSFLQVHTSQKWYQAQDKDRSTFLQSPAYLTLKDAAEAEGLDLRPSDPGEVYHVELVSKDARKRLNTFSNDPPVAVVCIKSKEQLKWYVPITSDGAPETEQLQNRCHQFRFMYRGTVQKIRHLQAMGYRPAVVWMSEWNNLSTQEQRRQYLRDAIGTPGRRSAAFSPSAEQDAYV
eukprot:TRINITY_DN37437_c0_g1_i1.p1 TRINITY_DN37437_c0_g1~~TRINITY_DN37437_c0_g1_i1.p1  ORF type:complete len:1206 (+),score=153.05 TRINITY_DN37437_c0_g1_i1:77-3694(+)